jgi:hypothetical protein
MVLLAGWALPRLELVVVATDLCHPQQVVEAVNWGPELILGHVQTMME